MSQLSDADNKIKRPLDGIRVLEYGIFHAGPGASAILGDLGADIIKIESGNGDPSRHWTFLARRNYALPNGESAMFHIANRNKKGIYLDIENKKGRNIFHELVSKSDIFLTNLRKSTKIKLGLDYDTLSMVNSKIIYASVSGYGAQGPISDLGAFDPLGLARSGMMFVTGKNEPSIMHVAILDQATAIAASHGILTALFTRERYGIGQEVHISLYGTGLWLMFPNLLANSILSINPIPSGNRFEHSPLRNFYRCKDEKWIIGAHHDEKKYWPIFCEATGEKELINHPYLMNSEVTFPDYEELVIHFDRVFATKTRSEWMDIFLSRGLMFCPIQHLEEIKNDPQALLNQYIVDYEDHVLGNLKIPGYPIHFSKFKAGIRRMGPGLGEHSEIILREMGYGEKDLQQLKKEGVIR